MSIQTQLCGLVIILLLMYFFGRQPTLGLNSEQRFRFLLYLALACVLLDIASCYTIYHMSAYPLGLVALVAKLYLASLITIACQALHYSITEVYEKNLLPYYRFRRTVYWISYGFFMLLMLASPIELHNDNGIYSDGRACDITYVACFIYIVLVIYETMAHRKLIKLNKQAAVMSWMTLWIVAAIIQFLFPRVLVVSFACCAGMLIVFFEMENPEAVISRRKGHFSSAAILDYFEYLYKRHTQFSILMISFATVADSTQDSLLLRKSINQLSQYLFSIRDTHVFDTAEGYFILVFEDAVQLEITRDKVNAYFDSIENSQDVQFSISLLNPYYTMIPDCNIASNAEELLSVISGFVPTDHRNFEKNEVVVNEETITNLRKRKVIEDMVIDAMENDRVEVFYQPIYNITTGTFCAAEALVRIKLADGTYVTPDSFIPVIESTGRIVALSDSVYRQAMTFIRTYHLKTLGIDHIDLNLSVKQAESATFAARFTDLLHEQGIDGSMINLEITETSSVIRRENMLLNMSRLETEGVCFSLDDFGSGSSNLNYIIDMPVKVVKLDKVLTDAYFVNKKAEAIVDAVINLCHSLNIQLIAEGVENKRVFDAMVHLGVDYIQGYYFCKPMPMREFLSFIQKHNLQDN